MRSKSDVELILNEKKTGRTAPEFQVGTLKMVVFSFKLYFLLGKKHK